MDVVHLALGEIAPFADAQPVQADIHDANPLELEDLIAQRLAHAANLAIEPLRQDDAEHIGGNLLDAARLGDGIQNRHAGCHALEKVRVDRLVDPHHIFLLVGVAGPQDLVDDVAVTGQKDQAIGGLVEATDREDPLGMADVVNDVAFHVALGGTGDAHRLVEGQIDRFLLGLQRLAVDQHLIARRDLGAHLGDDTIDGHSPFGDMAVRLAPRAEARFADELVEAGKRCVAISHGRSRACAGR